MPKLTQNSHQVGPNTSERPPIRKPAIMTETANQETERPWKDGKDTGVPGTCDTNGITSCPEPVPAPATALAPYPAPLASTLPAVAGPTCLAMRAAPFL